MIQPTEDDPSSTQDAVPIPSLNDPSLTAIQVPFCIAWAILDPSSVNEAFSTAHIDPGGRLINASIRDFGEVAMEGALTFPQLETVTRDRFW